MYCDFGWLGRQVQPLVPWRSVAILPLESGQSMMVAFRATASGAAVMALAILAAVVACATAADGYGTSRMEAATARAGIVRSMGPSNVAVGTPSYGSGRGWAIAPAEGPRSPLRAREDGAVRHRRAGGAVGPVLPHEAHPGQHRGGITKRLVDPAVAGALVQVCQRDPRLPVVHDEPRPAGIERHPV